MEPIQILLTFGNLITLAIAIAAFSRQGKKDSQDLTEKITTLQGRVGNLQEIINAANINEFSAMKQSMDDLKRRVEKLDIDVDKKIDQLSNKMDQLVGKVQEVLISISKFVK